MRVVAIGLLVLGSSLLQIASQPPQQPVFRAETDVVTIDVSVSLRNAPVPGLTAHDFELLDNGVPQQIELETVESVPADVSVVFDQSTYSQHMAGLPGVVMWNQSGSDLKAIVDLLRPIDRLRVILFHRDVLEVIPLQTSSLLQRQGLLSSPHAAEELLRAGLRVDRGQDLHYDPRLRGAALFDGLLLALARPPEPSRRHLVVALVTGFDQSSIVDGNLLFTVAARSDALIHVVSPWGAVSQYPLIEYCRLALTSAAAATGGDVHQPGGDRVFKSIFANFRQSYLARYTLKGVPRSGWHTVVVKTPRFPAYTVRTRSGYMGR